MSSILIKNELPSTTTIVLNRPERRNALTIDLLEKLCDAVKKAERDPAQRILLLRGAGDAFCAGLDLNEALADDATHRSAKMVAQMLKTMSDTPLVTIAAVHKAAVAGGAGLMSSCDLVVATEDTKIGYPEVRRGLVAALVMTFLKRQLGERRAKELVLTGELISAAKAQTLGLINAIAPSQEELMEKVNNWISSILQGAPSALAHTKEILSTLGSTSIREDLDEALARHLQARESDDAREGIQAFLEKRPPQWAVTP